MSASPRLLVTGKLGQVALSLANRVKIAGFDAQFIGRPEMDMASPDTVFAAVVAAIDAYQPTAIVNAAAYTAVDQAEDEPNIAHAVNALSAGEVARAAASAGLPIIHISTDYVFDGTKQAPYTEDDKPNPKTAYGRSKLAGEHAVAHANPNHIILRTAWVYSPFGKNFVKTMLKLAETRREVRVVADQFGNPTSAFDIADGIIAAVKSLDHKPDHHASGVYHLAGPAEMSWAEFAERIFAESAKCGGPAAQVAHITTADYPTRAMRPGNSRLDSTLFQRAFNWHASPDSVRQTVVSLLQPN
jgi:dTDP-4-dehydrorhamnose reductase